MKGLRIVKHSYCIQLPWHGKLSYGRIPATARAKGVSNVGYTIDRHQGRRERRNFTVTSANSVELTTRWLKLWYLRRRSQCMMLLARRRRTPEFEELKPFPRDGLIMYAVRIVNPKKYDELFQWKITNSSLSIELWRKRSYINVWLPSFRRWVCLTNSRLAKKEHWVLGE